MTENIIICICFHVHLCIVYAECESIICVEASVRPQPVAFNIHGIPVVGASTAATCLQASSPFAVNTPAQPNFISPQAGLPFSWNGNVSLPSLSYCIYTLSLTKPA